MEIRNVNIELANGIEVRRGREENVDKDRKTINKLTSKRNK